MRKRKPQGWPKYMEARASKGIVRYYWNAPSWARKRGYQIKSEPLGADYGPAKARCDDVLNPMFESWRTGGSSDLHLERRPPAFRRAISQEHFAEHGRCSF